LACSGRGPASSCRLACGQCACAPSGGPLWRCLCTSPGGERLCQHTRLYSDGGGLNQPDSAHSAVRMSTVSAAAVISAAVSAAAVHASAVSAPAVSAPAGSAAAGSAAATHGRTPRDWPVAGGHWTAYCCTSNTPGRAVRTAVCSLCHLQWPGAQ